MKKFLFTLVMGIMLCFSSAYAQVEPAKLFDNTSVALKGGVATPLNDFGTVSYGKVGVELEKWITPWVGVAADGNFYIAADNGYDTYTAFDAVNVNGLVKLNLLNMFGKFNGARRTFEPTVFTGLGWWHNTAKGDCYGLRNTMAYKAGADIDFNLGEEKAWAIRLQPAVLWLCPTSGKLSKSNALFEINAGVVYRFKNHDGNRTFTMVRRYDQAEIDNLNAAINSLREKNDAANACIESLKYQLANTSAPAAVERIESVDTVMLMPKVQFMAGSSQILATSLGNVHDMAEYMKANPEKQYTIYGYASSEGNEAYNLGLSERRAEALKNMLVEYGVDASQLATKAEGATEQFSNELRTMNRVVVVEESK